MRKFFIVAIYMWTCSAMAASCLDVGYYCQNFDNRYDRVEYIEFSGTQYIDTGIPLNSKYDMEMQWQNTRLVHDKWVSGVWTAYEQPAIHLTGIYQTSTQNLVIAMYGVDHKNSNVNKALIPYDTNIHTTYCYKNKGIWIDTTSNLKPVDYTLTFPSDRNFLVGVRQTATSIATNTFWYGRVYSFVFKNNGNIVAEFVPAYDTIANQYGLYNKVSHEFFSNLGSGQITGTASRCTNAPEHSHYTGTGTANDCPWECDSGYEKTQINTCAMLCDGAPRLRTDTISLKLYSEKQTHPALAVEYKNNVCYVNMVYGKKSGAINVQYGDNIFHLAN